MLKTKEERMDDVIELTKKFVRDIKILSKCMDRIGDE